MSIKRQSGPKGGTASGVSEELFFRDIVDGYVANRRFLRRDWLSRAIHENTENPNNRFVVVIGPAGSGKSSLIAQLADEDPQALVYFLRRDQRTPLAEGSAKSFLVRIGFQFAAFYPELFEPDALRISVTQLIERAGSASEVTGVRIKELLASPFYQEIIQVHQDIGSSEGRVTAVDIDRIISDPALLGVTDLAALALAGPARSLKRQQPGERIVILVDALDELSANVRRMISGVGAGESLADSDLLSWLRAGTGELPDNIRFVITSRQPDDALQAFLDQHAQSIATVHIDPSRKDVRRDIESYTASLAVELRSASLLSTSDAENQFVADAIEKARGNLGYLDAIARAYDHSLGDAASRPAVANLLSLDALPPSLEDLYAFFLRQLKAAVAGKSIEVEDKQTLETRLVDAWPAIYQKLLAVLSVTFDPLTLEQLIDLVRTPVARDYVVTAVKDLRQFLDSAKDDGRISFYHSTIGEFLTAEQTAENAELADLWIDEKHWHHRIAVLYDGRFTADAKALDEYALKYRIGHHLAGKSPDQAYEAITTSWMTFKRELTGDDLSFHSDLTQVISFLQEQEPLPVVRFSRCCLIDAMLLARAKVTPRPLAGVWTLLGKHTKAEAIISLTTNPGERANALLYVARDLSQFGDPAAYRKIFRRALRTAESSPYYGDRLETLDHIAHEPDLDAELAAALLRVADKSAVEAEEDDDDDELEWHDSALASIYRQIAPQLDRSSLEAIADRLSSTLRKSGMYGRARISAAAALVNDRLERVDESDVLARKAIEAADEPGIQGISALCDLAQRLSQLKSGQWAGDALALALQQLREGLDPTATPYAIGLITLTAAKIPLDVDIGNSDLEHAVELGRRTEDVAVFGTISQAYAQKGDLNRAREVADIGREIAEFKFGRNQKIITQVLVDAVIPSYTAAHHRAGLEHIAIFADRRFRSGGNWERQQLVVPIVNAAATLGFPDVLEAAEDLACNTRDLWERAEALAHVARGHASLKQLDRAFSVARRIEGEIAEGLRQQYPRYRLRGALVLALAQCSDNARSSDLAQIIEDLDYVPYRAAARATTLGRSTKSPDDGALAAAVAELSDHRFEVLPLYALLKSALANDDRQALDAIKTWAEESYSWNDKTAIKYLLTLVEPGATADNMAEQAEALIRHVDQKQMADAAFIGVDALVMAGMLEEATALARNVATAADRREWTDSLDQIYLSSAAAASLHALGKNEEALGRFATFLEESRLVESRATAHAFAANAPLIGAAYSADALEEMVEVVEEVSNLS